MEYPTVKIEEITEEQLTSIFDHTFLKTEGHFSKDESPVMARKKALQKFLEETLELPGVPYSICIRPEDVKHTSDFLRKNGKESIKVCSVVGFPDGPKYGSDFKVSETQLAISSGASEIDMVLDYESLKENNIEKVSEDILAVINFAHEKGVIVKVILETSELDSGQIKTACKLCDEVGADFVKTSTGFSVSGANKEDLTIMRAVFPRGVKASGGVKPENTREILQGLSGRDDGLIDLDPMKIRIGEGSYLN